MIGSFLNVAAFRYYPEEESFFSYKNWGGRSRCQHCHQQLSWFELIPVLSFLIQKGRCWICRRKISWQYPIVELASGFIFLLPFYFQKSFVNGQWSIVESVIWILVFLTFLLIWAIDYRLYIIPDELSFLLGVLGLLATDFSGKSFLGSYALLFGLSENVWQNHLAGLLVGAALVGFIIIFTGGRGMGMGDLKLMGALGLLYGWPEVLFIFAIASIIGAAASLILMLVGKKTMRSHIPFGPFLVLGATAVFFFGEALLKFYFNSLGFF